MQITADQKPGYDQVEAINQWLQKAISYKPGSSYTPLSAVEINLQQSGVCRDLAHLGIALCRSLCIPARLVVGYLYDLRPMKLHAWFEAYVKGRWYTFDATQISKCGGWRWATVAMPRMSLFTTSLDQPSALLSS